MNELYSDTLSQKDCCYQNIFPRPFPSLEVIFYSEGNIQTGQKQYLAKCAALQIKRNETDPYLYNIFVHLYAFI